VSSLMGVVGEGGGEGVGEGRTSGKTTGRAAAAKLGEAGRQSCADKGYVRKGTRPASAVW
jgi:hypothetical protein